MITKQNKISQIKIQIYFIITKTQKYIARKRTCMRKILPIIHSEGDICTKKWEVEKYQRYSPSGVPSCFLYKTFSFDFLKSSFVTFIRRSLRAMSPASVQMAWREKIKKDTFNTYCITVHSKKKLIDTTQEGSRACDVSIVQSNSILFIQPLSQLWIVAR